MHLRPLPELRRNSMKLEKRASFGWPATAAGSAPCKNGMVAHYDGSDLGLAKKDHSACRTYWKNTRRFHMGPDRGWLDIGYSFGVCPHGIVFEGRGFGHVQAAQPGGNTTWTSCTFMSGEHETPTPAQLEAWRELRAWLRGKGVAAAVKGHGEFISTSCPGGILRKMVKDGTLTKGTTSTTPPPKPATSPPWPGRLLVNKTPMMHGPDVLAWQRQMRARGWTITTDGYYGSGSAGACRAFQAEKGLTTDGIVGRDTWIATFTAKVT